MSFDTSFDAAFEAPSQDETTALLIRARSFLERGWCRHTQARDANDEPVGPHSDRAVSWCAYGALLAAGMPNGVTHSAFVRLQAAIGGERMGEFNNAQKTVEPVLAAFDRAIAMSAGG